MANLAPDVAYKMYLNHRTKDPRLLCSIIRTCDDLVYAYFAQRVGDQLVGKGVDCQSLQCGKFDKLEPCDPILAESFYHMDVKQIEGTKTYLSKINAFPEREMTLRMKKAPSDTKDAHPGFTLAYGTLEIAPGVKVENVHVHTFLNDLVFPDLGAPDLRAVTVYGVVPNKNLTHVPKEVRARCCVALDEDNSYVTEKIVVTDALRKRFDVLNLTKRLLQATLQ